MNYQVLNLIQPYFDESNLFFYALVSKEWHTIINKKNYSTPYSCLTTKSLLSYSHDKLKLVIDEKVKEVIIKLGTLSAIQYLHTKTDIIDPKYLNYAALSGHLDTMKWLKSKGCLIGVGSFQCASREGHVDAMKWLQGQGCPNSRSSSI